MFALFYCVKDQHDLRLVILAGLICVTSAMVAVVLLRQARDAARGQSWRWLVAAALSSAFGVWATHFIAMQGFDPGVVRGYRLGPTLASLLIAMMGTLGGFTLALRSHRRLWQRVAGALVGLSIAAMHYLGMEALELPGTFLWSPAYVLASVLYAVVAVTPALEITLQRRGAASAVNAALLIVLGVLLLHFTGMTAISIVPGRPDEVTAALLSPMTMGFLIGGLAFSVLMVGMLAALISSNARIAIEAHRREFELLVQGITDCALYMLDPDGRVVSWNAGAQRLKGFTSTEAIGLNFSSFYGAADRGEGIPRKALTQARETGKFTAQGWRYRKDGTRFWADVTIEPVIGDQGDLVGFAKITRDISRQKEAQDELASLTRKLDAALTNMHQGLVLLSEDERVVLVNARFRSLYNLPHELDATGMPFVDFMRVALTARGGVVVNDERIAMAQQWMRACLAQPGGGGSVTISYDDDSVVDIAYRSLPEGGVVATFEDVSERHRSATRIAHMAMHDDLTDLPNRINFNNHVDEAMVRAQANGSKLAIVAIDFDRFKEVNDTHGHGGGDLVLCAIAKRMTAGLKPNERVARLGGDEFAGCCEYRSDAELDDFVERLLAAFQKPIDMDGVEIQPLASLGIAISPDDGQSRDQIFGNADLAMYRAKTTGGMRACRYEPGMDEVARTRRAMAKDLRDALVREEFSLAFQIQRAVDNGDVTGYEALLRWKHPVDGWISPQDFIPIAEESGCIVDIGEWVLRKACQEAVTWTTPHRVAVNLSPVQLTRPDLMARVAEILMETGLPPSRLELEITETAIIADKATALHTLRQIKSLGVTIAIDDFGTGYSSLETLNSFPFDKIKIDRSFVMEAERSEQARAIIRAVIALATSLRMPVLAEGVETEGQLSLLRTEGCTEAQGYLFGQPSFDPVADQSAA